MYQPLVLGWEENELLQLVAFSSIHPPEVPCLLMMSRTAGQSQEWSVTPQSYVETEHVNAEEQRCLLTLVLDHWTTHTHDMFDIPARQFGGEALK